MKFFFFFSFFILLSVSFGYAQNDSTVGKELDEVIIKAMKRKEVVYKDHKYYILDYRMRDKKMYLLVSNLGSYYVYLMDSSMNQLNDLKLKIHPRNFYEDCLGQMHIISSDSMFRIGIENDQLIIGENASLSLYYSFYKYCVDKNGTALIYKEMQENNQKIVYTLEETYQSQRKQICTIQDEVRMRSVKDAESQLSDTLFEKHSADLDKETVKALRKSMDDYYFFQNVLKKPIYNPLFVSNDTIFVFDHVNEKLRVFDHNIIPIRDVSTSYSHHPKWNEKIILDKLKGQFYVQNKINGLYQLLLLNEVNGETEKGNFVSEKAFPEKIRVYDGYAYFLQKEFVDDNLNKLYRIKL